MRRLAALTLLLAMPSVASAKDLRQRVGVGFEHQLGQIPALSIKYGLPSPDPAINIQTQVLAGVGVYDSTGDQIVIGGRLLWGFLAEDNMNLYVGAGGAWFRTDNVTGFRLQPVMGAEAFLFGLENLGLTIDWGLNADIRSGGTVEAYTFGGGFGAHYYF